MLDRRIVAARGITHGMRYARAVFLLHRRRHQRRQVDGGRQVGPVQRDFRQAFEAGGKPVVNIVAELPGKSKPDEIIWVIAEYDAADASGIAALMCVAHALTGTEHSRTIRFAAVVNAHTLVETENGVDNLTRFNAGKSQAPRTIVDLSGLMTSPPEAWKQVEIRHLALLLRVYPIVPLEAMQKILWEVEKAADAP